MAKKDKKGDHSVQNKEIFQRMNFLYQAAMCMATITTPPPRLSATKDEGFQASTAVASQSRATTDNAAKDPETHGSVEKTVPVSVVPTSAITNSAIDINMEKRHQSPRKLSRKKTRKLLRERKHKIAMEQISDNGDHHRLTNPSNGHDLRPLSGTARFYASTLMEVGRKNVIRIGPVIKRSVCQRCEALLVPSISCEVRIEATPQLNTKVICVACGAFRRYFCMPGKGIEGDRWETEEAVNMGGNDTETARDSTATSTATTPTETHEVGSDKAGMEDSVMESAQGLEGLILQENAA